jgi:Inner membrane protein CreD
MTARRLIAVALVYACATGAWVFLGGSLMVRTGEFDGRLAQEVTLLWGGEHTQAAPGVWIERPRVVTEQVKERDAQGHTTTREVTKRVVDEVPVPLLSSRVRADLDLDHRRKGLLWYDTYAVRFAGTWRVRNPDAEPRQLIVRTKFPSPSAIYDGFNFRVGGVPAPAVSDLSAGAVARINLAPGGETSIDLAYHSRGLDTWTYAFGSAGVTQVRDFELAMRTDFSGIDFPAGSISPTTKAARPDGWDLKWQFANLVTGQRIGMDLPNRLNPGPLAARITWFAPVSLLFFLSVLVILGMVRGQNLHPMNYVFVSAAFFAFHLLLAYLVDHIDVHLAFVIASLTSVALVVSYLRLVRGTPFAVREAGLAQLVFLVLFSYAFFFEGYTGLTVTIGAIITLFVLMQVTARVNWAGVFARTQERTA